MLSAICSKLDQSKILSSGNGLKVKRYGTNLFLEQGRPKTGIPSCLPSPSISVQYFASFLKIPGSARVSHAYMADPHQFLCTEYLSSVVYPSLLEKQISHALFTRGAQLYHTIQTFNPKEAVF